MSTVPGQLPKDQAFCTSLSFPFIRRRSCESPGSARVDSSSIPTYVSSIKIKHKNHCTTPIECNALVFALVMGVDGGMGLSAMQRAMNTASAPVSPGVGSGRELQVYDFVRRAAGSGWSADLGAWDRVSKTYCALRVASPKSLGRILRRAHHPAPLYGPLWRACTL